MTTDLHAGPVGRERAAFRVAVAAAQKPRICGICGAYLNQRPHKPSCPLAGGAAKVCAS